MRHYFSGAYYIRGGPSEVPFQMVQVIEELGGRVLVNAPVSEIIMNSGRAVGRCWQKKDCICTCMYTKSTVKHGFSKC